ncbi:MAG TPA: oxygen-independent coproporphyrinogen III oxidase [Candidatus Competibacteraceae bacterium]|nr:oxygen-independent coproporphyrinogen III oxidase [Candidatus Competibacteraceae bacterium]
MDTAIVFDPALIRKYDRSGPRYTSYPTAVQFSPAVGAADYVQAARASNAAGRPLSLYFHIPFCARVCFYCACNKIITANRKRAEPYVARLKQEIAQQGALYDRSRKVVQLHWGGGTPTFLSDAQMAEVMQATAEHFHLLDDDSGDYSIEIDPREVDADTIAQLRGLGFNRMSLGVQDFDPEVQRAVNRIQPKELTLATLEAARAVGFRSINLDLIYGLPRQTVASFARTLDAVLEAAPDRLSVFNYAHLPELFKSQRQIRGEELPSPAEKLEILKLVIARLTEAGYVYIGMDHFARPDDPLAVAQQSSTLHRNFQGYSTHADCDLVAMGMTAIGMLEGMYIQNAKDLETYYGHLDRGELPVVRGVALDGDDRLRREIITRLICDFALDSAAVERHHGIVFADYFATELAELREMAADGLLTLSAERITVSPAGRLLIRNICMVFDRYLRQAQEQRFSKVI